MATLSPDIRNSTFNALKLTCPSAEVVHDASHSVSEADSPAMEPHQFVDEEWSDEDQLLPAVSRSRRKTQYIPPHVKITSTAESLSGGSSATSPDRTPANASPLKPFKNPSRPDMKTGGSHDDLIQQYYQVTRERDALRKELQRRSVGPHGIPTGGRASVVYKSEEKSLIEELQALRYEIRKWTEEYFSGPPSSRSRRPHMHSAKDLFGGLTDNYNVYLKHAEDRPFLIQALIWSRLQNKIFNNWQRGSGYVWAGKLGDRKLRPLNDTLRKAVKNEEQAAQYHHWRSQTINLLIPHVEGKWCPTFDTAPVLKNILRFCSRLRRKLRPWATQSLSTGKEQLHSIISGAVALDLKMKRQRADYRFVAFTGGKPNQYYGYGFYDSEMEDADESENETRSRRVELALAPALERSGNANGHVFDQSFILVKADVSCKRLEKQQGQARSRGGSSIKKRNSGLGSFWKKEYS